MDISISSIVWFSRIATS